MKTRLQSIDSTEFEKLTLKIAVHMPKPVRHFLIWLAVYRNLPWAETGLASYRKAAKALDWLEEKVR